MAENTDRQAVRHRLAMAAIGATGALALWVLGDQWDDTTLPPALFLAGFTFVATYFGVALALAGPVPVARALKGALLIAVPLTALVSLAGQGQVEPTDLLDRPVLLGVICVLVFFSLPFLLVWLDDRREWRSYPALFDAAWSLVVRYTLADIFVLVFWLVVFLSTALLMLVGVDILQRLLETEWVPFAVSGAVLGLGLAVIYELRGRLSPTLVLRLLRLLVPVVLLVLAVFLGAIPLGGLDNLFSEISAAATLMGAAIVAITLISAALDRDDEHAVRTRGIRVATRILALLLVPLAGLAVWAVVLRVRQYGWTPDRVLAMTTALFLLAYGAGYAVAVLRGRGWAARVRRVNVAMALAVIGVGVLWLTPVLDPYRISANNQIARYEAGRATLGQLPVWDMQHEWGRAGRAGLEYLAARTDLPEHATLLERIRLAEGATSRYQFTNALEDESRPDDAKELARLMAIRPEGARLPEGAFDDIAVFRLGRWLEGCRRKLPDGRAGCVLVLGPFSAFEDPKRQGMLVYLDSATTARVQHVVFAEEGDMQVRDTVNPDTGSWGDLPAGAVAQVLDGDFDIRPVDTRALHVGGVVLVPGN